MFLSLSLTVIISKAHFVQSSLTCHGKEIIFSVSSISFRVFKLHSKSAFCFCQAIHLIESEPKLTIQATKSALVVIPSSLKINWTVQSFLDHGPTSTSGFLITENIKGAWTIRVNCVNSAGSLARFVQFSAVLLYCNKESQNNHFSIKTVMNQEDPEEQPTGQPRSQGPFLLVSEGRVGMEPGNEVANWQRRNDRMFPNTSGASGVSHMVALSSPKNYLLLQWYSGRLVDSKALGDFFVTLKSFHLKNCWSVWKFEDLSSCKFIRKVTPKFFSLSRTLEISRQYLLLRTVILEKEKVVGCPWWSSQRYNKARDWLQALAWAGYGKKRGSGNDDEFLRTRRLVHVFAQDFSAWDSYRFAV